MSRLLEISDLRVEFATRNGPVEALKGVSLSVGVGETLGIVGESGSGKSVTAFCVMRLLDRAGRIAGGHIRFRGEDITRAGRRVLAPLRGAAMSMIFQNPRAALNPIRPVGLQIADVLRAHESISAREARERAVALLEAVRIRDPVARLAAYPHELSGGMCQRVMIAMAIACEPSLLIADEPTTGLDVTTQKTVMDLLAETTARRGMAMLLITHDLGLAAQYCGRIAVMEQGRVVEEAPPARLFGTPGHAYTRRLVAASPRRDSTVASLVGAPEPQPMPLRPRQPLLEVRELGKRFGTAAAVDGVSFHLDAGESLGLVGESGSGKSTISRLVCRLLDPSEGSIRFDGEEIGAIPAGRFHRSPYRRAIQLVFQDHGESLNPRFSAFDSIADPLRRLLGLRDGAGLRARVEEAAERVGLPGDLLGRFPHQLSGGQKARVGIARAIAAGPRLLVLDEPTAALDVSVQAVVLHLLDRLRRESGLAYLFVSHDLNVVRMMCERTIVLQTGKLVEEGRSEVLFAAPRASYTAELLAAIPHFAPEEGDARARAAVAG
ncbi:nickel ABC transporter ATP-binding protein NikE [Belnapia rosea]|uniref:Peptide/nickel transport system ATP-binding protein n=1 Tax=Belnapia rosea TaxID=938405 RepID=A0A1G6S3H7_9PROT|nr:ABC transporter ATP-binding protein [Belnapia rosea]SDD11399.1 peptide/nickel transport system ATP-binding protein [Belnapia rosea]